MEIKIEKCSEVMNCHVNVPPSEREDRINARNVSSLLAQSSVKKRSGIEGVGKGDKLDTGARGRSRGSIDL